MKPIYKRLLIKLSGEALAGNKGFGIDMEKVNNISENIKILYSEKYNEAGRPPAFKGRSARRFFTAFFAAIWAPLFKGG